VLGVVVTFIGQALTRRQTSALSIAEQKAALRNDRREAIFAFIDIARTVYVIAQQREEKGAPFDIDDKVRAMDHQLWFSAQCIDVLCTDEFRTATEEYTSTLYGHLLNTNFNTGELSGPAFFASSTLGRPMDCPRALRASLAAARRSRPNSSSNSARLASTPAIIRPVAFVVSMPSRSERSTMSRSLRSRIVVITSAALRPKRSIPTTTIASPGRA
jgi:hypothetical protein